MDMIWEFINPSNDYLSAIIGMIMSIIALALPISQNTISDRLAAYHNKHVLEMFKVERTYKAMHCSILLLIFTLVFSILFNESLFWGKLVGLLCLFAGIASVIIFWLYFRRTNQYAINTDSVVFDYCKKKMAALPNSRENYKERWELIEMAACVIEHKEKSGDYADIEEIVRFMEDSFIEILKEKSYASQERNQSVWDYSMKYYSLYLNLWKNCYRKSPSTADMLMSPYNRVVKCAILHGGGNDCVMPPYVPLFYLYQQIAASLEPEDKKTPRTAEYCWKWYFDAVLSDDFPEESVITANAYLLTVMKNIVDYDIIFVFKAYVGHIIDSLLVSKYEDFGVTGDLKISLQLSKLQQKSHSVVLLKEYREMLNDLDAVEVEDVMKENLKRLIKRRFIYNNIQLVTLLIGSYALFLKKFDFVKALIYYNQPIDSEVSFANKDIVPDTFDDLVGMYMKAHFTTMPFFTIWPEHHDITHCYKQFVYFLTFVLANQARPHLGVNVSDYNENSQQLAYLQHVIEQFEKAVSGFSEDELNKLDIPNGANCKVRIQQAINNIKKNIYDTDAHLKQWQKLDEEKVKQFKVAVINQTKNNSLWVRAFGENDLEDGTRCEHKFGLTTFMEKSFLAENDNGMYVGFPQGFSSELIRQIDFFVERKLMAQHAMYPFSGFKISETDFKRKVMDFDKDFSAAFINVLDYHESLYDAPGIQWIWKGDKAGITAKGCTIYYFGDPDISLKRLVVFNKHSFSKLEVVISEDGFKVIDLNTSDEDRKILYGSSSLRGFATDAEKDEELKKCVLVEIHGEVSFYMKNDAEIAYVEDKKLDAKLN